MALFLNNMRIFHILSDTFVSNMFPEKGDEISLLIASDELLDKAILRYDDYSGLSSDSQMSYLGFRDNAHFYKASMRVFNSNEMLSYFFIVEKDGRISYYSKRGVKNCPPNYQARFKILPSLDAPKWITDVSCYQIFPDRFFNGDSSNDVKSGEYEFDGALVQAKNFSELPGEFEESRCLDFYNGDLKGIEDKLDYLKSLGISLIYLNPIFRSRTVHRYDSTDFFNVDEKLGGNEALISLIKKAHEKGIKIMLDISINHVGTDSAWYKGALKGNKEYSSYFTHNSDGSIKYWNGVKTLADLDYHSEKLRDIIYRKEDRAMRSFLRPPYGIDAWRLDVAPEVARTEEESLCLDVWRQVRASLKEEKRDLYLVGEGWDDSYKYLKGDAWDSTMNYFGSSRIFRTLLGEEDRFLTQGWGFPPKKRRRISAYDASDAINEYLNGNMDQAVYFMMNLINSHDTPRLYNHDEIMDDDRYLSLILLLYMLPGFPSIYYGEEIKLDGRINSVEGSRYPMQWDEEKWNRKYLSWYSFLGQMRKKRGFGKSAYRITSLDEDTLLIFRYLEDETLLAVSNFSEEDRSYEIDPFLLKGNKSSTLLGPGISQGLKISVKAGSGALFSFKTC